MKKTFRLLIKKMYYIEMEMLINFFSLTEMGVVKMTSGAARDCNFIKLMAYQFQWYAIHFSWKQTGTHTSDLSTCLFWQNENKYNKTDELFWLLYFTQ